MLAGLTARGFRNLEDDTEIEFGAGLTLITGPNGAGKTNLLEATFLALTGHSPRTNRLREVVGFGKPAARVSATVRAGNGVGHTIVSAVDASGDRRRTIDGAPGGSAEPARPPVVVFMPDRLELVKGPPAGRRAHLDQLVAVLWPGLAGPRREYSSALAQRNALLAAIRGGRARRDALEAWNETLARAGAELVGARTRAAELIAEPFTNWAERLGLTGRASVEYRPRVECGGDPAVLRTALEERADSDIERGHTTTGPHHDELAFRRESRALRSYGSQGEQRLTLLALLLAEREVVADSTGRPPVALFDDVMSELDPERRRLLATALAGPGQALVTTTESEHVPPTAAPGAVWRVEAGTLSAA